MKHVRTVVSPANLVTLARLLLAPSSRQPGQIRAQALTTRHPFNRRRRPRWRQ